MNRRIYLILILVLFSSLAEVSSKKKCELDCSKVICELRPYIACKGVEVPGQCCLDYSNCEVCPKPMPNCARANCGGPKDLPANCRGIYLPCKCCPDYSHCCATASCPAPPPGCEPRIKPNLCCPDISHCK